MKKISLFILGITVLFFLSFNDSFSQTISKAGQFLAENLVSSKKVYVVDSIALSAFVEKKENELKIKTYFEKRDMPLHTHAEKFIEVAKKYNLDPFLLPTISIKESTGGKFLFKSYNPFGFGQKKFDSFDEAIEYVGETLANGKYYKGKTLEKKLRTYNSVQKKYVSETFQYMKIIQNQKITKIDPMIYVDSFKVEKSLLMDLPKKEIL